MPSRADKGKKQKRSAKSTSAKAKKRAKVAVKKTAAAKKKAALTKKATAKKARKSAAKPSKATAKKKTAVKKKTATTKKKPVAKKKAAAKKTAPKKKVAASKKKVAAKKKAAPKKKTAPKRTAPKPTARRRLTKPSRSQVVIADIPEAPDGEVILVPPHSTIEGAEPHAADSATSSVVAVSSAKYEVTPPDRIIEPVYPEERATELSAGYGDTRLVIMVRDPEWLYLYWEISPTVRKSLGLAAKGRIESLVVRLHDTTDVEDFNGMNAVAWYEIPITRGATNWYCHVPQVDREWCAELGILNERGEFVQICRSNKVRTPRNHISATVESVEAEWMSVSEELHEILARSADITLGSSQVGSEAAIRRISRRLRLALEGAGASGGMSGSIRPRAPKARPASEDEVPLTVRTEIVVSGSTDPNAELTVQGEPVSVRPDGSFSLRFELPEGKQVIEVRAASEDGDLAREIIPVVQKATRPETTG